MKINIDNILNTKISFSEEKLQSLINSLKQYNTLLDSSKILLNSVYKNSFLAILKRKSALGTTSIEKIILDEYSISSVHAIDVQDYRNSKVKEKNNHIHEAFEIISEYSSLDQEKDILSIDYLKHLHRRIFNKTLLSDAGKLKTENNRVLLSNGEHLYFLEPKDLNRYLNELFFKVKNDFNHNSIIASIFFHYAFVAIHPFDDGNGRISRLISTNLFYFQNKVFLPIDEQLSKDSDGYRNALNKVHIENDSTYFINYIIDTYIKQIISNTELFDLFSKKQPLIKEQLLKTKIKKIYHDQITSLLLAKKIINTKEAKYYLPLNIDKRTISKILKNLIDINLIKKIEDSKTGRFNTYEVLI